MPYSYHYQRNQSNVFSDLWNSFWNPPEVACPKCGKTNVEYYDPFFFSPMRTLKGRRRIRCCSCHFIWRPNRRSKSILDKLRQSF